MGLAGGLATNGILGGGGAAGSVVVSSPVTGQTAFYNGSAWVTRPTDLLADPAIPDGTTDNTTYLSGRLTVALALGVTLRIPKGTSGNWVVSKFTIPSNSSVDATGATFVQPASTSTRLILNTSLTLATPGSTRDSNISWTGGTFTKGTGQTNASVLDDMVTMFGFVDGLTLNNISISQSGTGGLAGTGGTYGCFLWNCTSFAVNNYSANSTSQSVNQSTLQLQYCQNGHIKGVTGTFGDDCVALVNGNLAGYLLTNGAAAMQNITVEDVYGTSPSTGVRLMGGATNVAGSGGAPFYNLQRIKVQNVGGNYASRGGTGAVYVGGSSSGTYPTLQNAFSLDIDVSNVTQTRASTPAIYVDANNEIHGLVLRAVNNQQDSPAVIIASTGSSHSSVKVADCDFTSAITTGTYYPIQVSGSTCRNLTLENLRINGAATGTATVGLVQGTSGPGEVFAHSIRGTGKVYILGTYTSTTRIWGSAIEHEDANGLGYFQTNTGAVVDVRDWSSLSAGVDGIVVTAGTVVSNTPTFRADVGLLVTTTGSMAWNTNASRSCGVGPCARSSTAWVNLATGATF